LMCVCVCVCVCFVCVCMCTDQSQDCRRRRPNAGNFCRFCRISSLAAGCHVHTHSTHTQPTHTDKQTETETETETAKETDRETDTRSWKPHTQTGSSRFNKTMQTKPCRVYQSATSYAHTCASSAIHSTGVGMHVCDSVSMFNLYCNIMRTMAVCL
jgi:hypothetical protein